jgi:hypothetical protein
MSPPSLLLWDFTRIMDSVSHRGFEDEASGVLFERLLELIFHVKRLEFTVNERVKLLCALRQSTEQSSSYRFTPNDEALMNWVSKLFETRGGFLYVDQIEARRTLSQRTYSQRSSRPMCIDEFGVRRRPTRQDTQLHIVGSFIHAAFRTAIDVKDDSIVSCTLSPMTPEGQLHAFAELDVNDPWYPFTIQNCLIGIPLFHHKNYQYLLDHGTLLFDQHTGGYRPVIIALTYRVMVEELMSNENELMDSSNCNL